MRTNAALVWLVFSLFMVSCEKSERGTPVDTDEAEPVVWPEDSDPATVAGPEVKVTVTDDRNQTLDESFRGQLPTAETLLAEVRSSLADIDDASIIRAARISSPEFMADYDLALSSVSVEEVLAGRPLTVDSLKIVQWAPDNELVLDVSFFPSEQTEYVLVIAPSDKLPDSYEIVETPSGYAYLYRAADDQWHFDRQTSPVVTLDALQAVLDSQGGQK